MQYVEIISFVLFALLMTLGYTKNNRNMMLVASLCLLIGLAGPDFIKGFQEGYNAAEIPS